MLEHLDSINTYEFDSDTIRFSGEVLVVVFSVGLIPMVDDGSGSADIEPLAEIATLANNYAQKARRKTVRAVDIKKAVRDLEREGGE